MFSTEIRHYAENANAKTPIFYYLAKAVIAKLVS